MRFGPWPLTMARFGWRARLLTALTLLLTASPASAAGLKVKELLPTDAGPQSVALADFNHDGKLDFAVASAIGTVSVQLGNGDGTFQAAEEIPVGQEPDSVIAADLNLDGNPDLVVANFGDDTISVLLGNGDGSFQPQLVFAVRYQPTGIAVGDFNKDGIPDVVVACRVSLVLLVGNGDGTFQPPIIPSTLQSDSVAVSDFNRDGNLDIAIGATAGGDGIVQVLLGHGDATFEPGAHYSLAHGAAPSSIATGDLNNDGNLDMATTTNTVTGRTLFVLLNRGDGTFLLGMYSTFQFDLVSVILMDLNRDGNLDVAAGAISNPDFVSVYYGNGDGTLQPRVGYNAQGYYAYAVAAGDLNHDGSPDVVVANYLSNNISVMLNTGGTFLKESSSLNPSHLGDSVTFTAQVKQSIGRLAPTGTVTFKDGSTTLGTVALISGVAMFTTSTLSAGTHAIVASYSGDANFNPNKSKPLVQIVNP